MALNFNVGPYYDDYTQKTTAADTLTPQEKYYRILFRPGVAVQARELTQLQTALQNQVQAVGDHLFKEGSQIIPGNVYHENDADFIKLDNALTNENFKKLEGGIITKTSNSLTATIAAIAEEEGEDPQTLYLRYTRSGTGQEKVFEAGDVLSVTTAAGETISATIAADGVDDEGNSIPAVGQGSIAYLDRGIYYVRKHFIIVQQQYIVLDKYSTNPSYDIGLQISEKIQVPANDPSLNDNAAGTPNLSAPGAHRYEITSKLIKQAVETTANDDFVLLIRVLEGIVQTEVRATDYNVIEETLARRTYDESGNYTVNRWDIAVHEHTEINTGTTMGEEDYGDETKLSVAMQPGKGYVYGYEIETLGTEYITTDKARETKSETNRRVTFGIGNYVRANITTGIPDIRSFAIVDLYDAASSGGTKIGEARVKTIRPGSGASHEIYLFDINMTGSNRFASVRSIGRAASPSNYPVFNANIIDSTGILYDTTSDVSVFTLPRTRVSTLNNADPGDPASYDFDYFVNRYFAATTTDGTGQAIFNSSGPNETFESDFDNWVLSIVSDGSIVPLASSNTSISTNGQRATITGLAASSSAVLIAEMRKTTEQKTKTLADDAREEQITTEATILSGDIQLGKADGYRLNNIYMSADFSTDATDSDTDITDRYDFDNGQRDNFYDLCRIRQRTGAPTPTGRLLVVYEYFGHTGSGDFFTVDSYSNLTDSDGEDVRYIDIPSYTTQSTGEEIELRSAIDFRPRINDDGDEFETTNGGSLSASPVPQSTITLDLSFYLGRIDKVYVDKYGEFGIVKGVSDEVPTPPTDPKDAMVLHHLFVPAYTLDVNEVEIQTIDNKRYTMRDIGRLEKRINTIEYYTALSLLEKEAADRTVLDPSTGAVRVKNGILVDSFTSHNVGNVMATDYRCSIDADRHVVRPLFHENNSRLMYNSGLSSNVQKTGDLITLPYTETVLYNQQQASDWINVNPFEVFKWVGSIDISPSNDEWKDTAHRPQLIVDQEGVFDAVQSVIDATDALGTVWGSWQNTWTGSPQITDQRTTSRVVGRDRQRTGRTVTRSRSGRRIDTTTTSTFRTDTRTRHTTTTTTATQRGQRSIGTQRTVVPDQITTNIGDRVVDTSFVPFVRSRKIFFRAERLKPNTRFYAFFDGVNVTDFCRPESAFMSYPDSDTNSGVYSQSNRYTEHPDGKGNLVSNAQGVVIGSFVIPNNDNTRFRTGTRRFILSDSETNSAMDQTSSGSAAYTARGLLETRENVVISTRIPRIESTQVSRDRIVTDTRRTVRSVDTTSSTFDSTSATSTTYTDPLAQSFIIQEPGGCFITSIDLFFHTKDDNIPVTLQIREMANGAPTPKIVPFGEAILQPSAVNVYDPDTELPNPNDATKFTFPSPVFLQENVEYCFVVMANSNKYNVWYAEVGQEQHSTGQIISKQPYTGVMFLSQNNSTFTPDQNKDMKFVMRRANFDTSSTGQLIMENGATQPVLLDPNPFTTYATSNVVRVRQKNHGFFNQTSSISSSVKISGISAAVNGIPAAQLNGTHVVSNVEQDSYTITVTTNATASGEGGGNAVESTENHQYSSIYPIIQELILPETTVNWGIRTAAGVSLGQTSPTPYQTDSGYSAIAANETTEFTTMRVVASPENNGGNKTLFMRGSLSSNLNNLSPIVDLERASAITIQNRIDNSEDSDGTDSSKNKVHEFTGEDRFIAETDPTDGSALAKYITKTVVLNDPSDGLRVFVDVHRPSSTFFDLYYKVSELTEGSDNTVPWILQEPITPISFTDGPDRFNEIEYLIDPAGTFQTFAIKIVMRSINQASVPQGRDLRIISII